jgi:hypothetical protein
MSAVLSYGVEFHPFDPAQDVSPTEPDTEPEEPAYESETEFEEPSWEPRQIHVPRTLVWAILIGFALLVVLMSIWGFARGTWWY